MSNVAVTHKFGNSETGNENEESTDVRSSSSLTRSSMIESPVAIAHTAAMRPLCVQKIQSEYDISVIEIELFLSSGRPMKQGSKLCT